MKAQELRIGNYHLYHIVDKLDERGEYDEVCQIDIEDLRILDRFDSPEYKPIPLSEEWLLKLGFKDCPGYSQRGTYFELDDIFICLTDFSVSLIADDPYCAHKVKQKIEYVHQLQNLYSALTGKELEIKS
jgi:hypothetical protein